MLENSNIILMRHATSDMNEALTSDAKLSKDFTYFDVALNPEMKDA